MALCPALAIAQEPPPPVPRSATEPEGLVPEPDPILRVVLFADRHLGKGHLNNGFYINQPTMVPGAGWLAGGPGWRHWYASDRVFVDTAAGISWNRFKIAHARVEVPRFINSRLLVGAEARWLDFNHLNHFGAGPASPGTNPGAYQIESHQVAAYATLRPVEWFGIGARAGWMNPSVKPVSGNLSLVGSSDHRRFVPTEAAVMVDTRDFPGHPTRGALVRAGAARYDDRTDGALTFKRYDGEVAGFVPVAGSRVVLALHGWVVSTRPDAGRDVPFYLEPTLGGANTLRAYADYRFHDRSALIANAEIRVAVMRHLDLALFADAGNVARRVAELNLDRRDFGAGLRLHTRRDTFALVDVARGDEGWRVLFRMADPLQLMRLTQRAVPVPFVP